MQPYHGCCRIQICIKENAAPFLLSPHTENEETPFQRHNGELFATSSRQSATPCVVVARLTRGLTLCLHILSAQACTGAGMELHNAAAERASTGIPSDHPGNLLPYRQQHLEHKETWSSCRAYGSKTGDEPHWRQRTVAWHLVFIVEPSGKKKRERAGSSHGNSSEMHMSKQPSVQALKGSRMHTQ